MLKVSAKNSMTMLGLEKMFAKTFFKSEDTVINTVTNVY